MQRPTTFEIISRYGLVCKLKCSCCGGTNLWEIDYGEGIYYLCSWCDVSIDQRWVR